MDIFAHIKKEHKEADRMLKDLSAGYDKAILDKLKLALKAHMEAEEKSLYPAMNEEAKAMVEHANKEHEEIRKLLKELDKGDKFTSDLSKLTHVIADHVKDEEEKMFPKAKDIFDAEEIKKLSEKFDEVDEKITQKAK